MKVSLLTIAKQAALASTVLVVLAAPLAPLVAQAATTDPNAGTVTVSDVTTTAPAGALGTTDLPSNGTSDVVVPNVTATPPPATSSGGPTAIPASNCALASGGSLSSGGDWAQCITDVVYVFTIGIGSGFAYVSAYFFDWAVSLSLNGGSYALDFVSQGWTIARDMANMAFLFILLYIAFKIIFQAETNETVHMLVLVIVIALLVNFSFFFTRLAIDAGNLLSIQFYNAIDAPSVASTASGSGITSTVASAATSVTSFGGSKDLTAGIMGMLNLQGLLGNTSFQKWRDSGPAGGYGFLSALITLSFLYVSAGIMLWLLTVAFIVNGVKFLVRIVVLWFLIIASPLAFVAYAVPKFKKYFDEWLDALIKHAFYPAAFMFIFLILTNFAKQVGNNNNLINGIFNGIQNAGSTSSIGALGYAIANVGIRMGFVIAMLYIGMEAAKKIGVVGAEAANHAGNWVSNRMTSSYQRAGGAAFAGTPAWLARNTVGWAGDRYSKSNLGRDLAARGGLLGRTAWRMAGAAGRQSYDARGGLAALGVKDTYIGKPGGQGGYTSAYAERIKKREEEAAKLKPSDLKYEQALQAEINKKPGEKAALSKLADDVARTKKDAEDNGSNENKEAYAAARKAFNDKAEPIIKAAKRASGFDNDKLYAGSIEKRTWRNAGGAGQGTPGWIWRADKESAIKIRGAKTDAERIKNMLPKSTSSGPTTSSGPSTAPGAGGTPGMAPFTRAAMEASRATSEKAAAGIVKAIQKKLDSTKLWSGSAARPTDNMTKMMREQLKMTRSSINKAVKSIAHERGAGSPTIVQRGRGGRPTEREGIREHNQAPLPPTPPPAPPSPPPTPPSTPPTDTGEQKE